MSFFDCFLLYIAIGLSLFLIVNSHSRHEGKSPHTGDHTLSLLGFCATISILYGPAILILGGAELLEKTDELDKIFKYIERNWDILDDILMKERWFFNEKEE